MRKVNQIYLEIFFFRVIQLDHVKLVVDSGSADFQFTPLFPKYH